jgi:hypothetical protein
MVDPTATHPLELPSMGERRVCLPYVMPPLAGD